MFDVDSYRTSPFPDPLITISAVPMAIPDMRTIPRMRMLAKLFPIIYFGLHFSYSHAIGIPPVRIDRVGYHDNTYPPPVIVYPRAPY
jgi:hypothetical protein